MAIVQLVKDKKDPFIIHIYSHYVNTQQYHIAAVHGDMISMLFERSYPKNDVLKLFQGKESIWLSYQPKLEVLD
jgi:hypothetical protein